MFKLSFDFNKLKSYADWKLLVFLVLFLNIKLEAKVLAIVFAYLLQFDFKFGFALKNSRLPLFYLVIIPIAVLGLVISQSYQNPNYWLVFLTGIGFWGLSILAVHQVKLMVEQNDTETIHRTISLFFILNALVSIVNLLLIIWQIKDVNPYTFKGLHQLYFVNTGDNIKGLTFDISSTNGALNVLGVIYFLVKKQPVMLLVCMVTLLLTTSNLITAVLLFVLAAIYAFNSNRDQKSLIVICAMLFVVFMFKISPQNIRYVNEQAERAMHIPVDTSFRLDTVRPITSRPDSTLNFEEMREKFATLYLDSLNRATTRQKPVKTTIPEKVTIKPRWKYAYEFRPAWVIEPEKQILLNFIAAHPSQLPLSSHKKYVAGFPGKLTGLIQSVLILYHNPAEMLTGMGIGNFSSKIAFRASGLGLRGKYPEKYTYISPAFLSNHLDLYMNFFSRDLGLHSITNNPSSVYDQLLSEYGLLGLLALITGYLWFFARNYRVLTYGIPLLFVIGTFFFIDYWFEQLSVVVMFELMMFLNIKENQTLMPHGN
ncbi:hypothetical protein BEL04_23305 [Mucilaginibacter sp. PPCGB 2223]|uniref:hypothetical protein n=1 Tax=Mucilaginibacter sp. PPCGB 2223 TaxID=1886027 RepID=UPI000826CABD|nr:hypothetical protein [Mucilaginibacter sp. PPCGB 2223]OCX50240.1 hypothetical protein BEL04_23305 [Mucilaginibacter sp. PPCGB 2223]